ncbi:hypothetical protein HY485_01685 [Candidatus Woesearchaeota archaeon]|nr:hypothetical protein [Candidatus Woesearchaeota archaeon]
MIGEKEVAEINECPACASLNIVQNTQREQIVCKDCGIIFQPTPLLEGTTAEKTKHAAKPKKKAVKNKKR